MLDKTYDPKDIEARRYPEWERSGAFKAHPESAKPPYCIVIPPPNVTGSLHMGHALDNTLQDILIRWRRRTPPTRHPASSSRPPLSPAACIWGMRSTTRCRIY